MKITHIISHLGGGVGKAVTTLINESRKFGNYDHSVICLDEISDFSKRLIQLNNIEVQGNCSLHEICHNSDIIQIEWWNHPLINKFIFSNKLGAARIIIYSHIAGFFPPSVFNDSIINYADKFVLSTRFSLEHKLIKNTLNKSKNKIKVIPSLSNSIIDMREIVSIKHNNFNVLYVGTVDFSKMHPNFVAMSSSIKIPGLKIHVCGGEMQNVLKKQAKVLGKENLFEFHGFVDNVGDFLAMADVFGYPLNEKHYGTGEQVILEAMSAGVVPVVFNNGCERNIVINNQNGLIVCNESEYVKAIEFLYNNKNIRKKLSKNAKKYASEKLNLSKYASAFNEIYDEILREGKKERNFEIDYRINKYFVPIGARIFLTFLGKYSFYFEKSIFASDIQDLIEADFHIARLSYEMKSKSKGSAFHYLRYFPNDFLLLYWCGLLSFGNNSYSQNLFVNAFNEGFRHWRIKIYIELLSEGNSNFKSIAVPEYEYKDKNYFYNEIKRRYYNFNKR
ncbi:MAG: glycosyltransferase family 4 protein [Lactobacillales bacterium]|jgi:glycosyltransferase involved in cell wall biosynthesis|nr:glycosyltransferase family 4 protein [Lactobacillales bacterium]